MFLRFLTPTYIRLYARLLKDRRVPLWPKALVALAAVYLLLPVDLVPDFMLVLGWLDDLTILGGSLFSLVAASPKPVVAQHLIELQREKNEP